MKNQIKIVALVVVMVVVVVIACAKPCHNANLCANQTSVDLSGFYALVDDLYQKDMLDGEVLVTQGDTVLFHRQSRELAAYDHSQFMIASISKHFTAVALLRALYDSSPVSDEAEKCAYVIQQLQKPIIEFLPPEQFAWGTTVPAWAYQITLHQLLSHTAGLVQHVRLMFEREGYEAVDRFFREAHSPAEIIQKFGHEPLQFASGSAYSYSNLGYELLAEVVAAVAHMPFDVYLDQHLFAPNGMRSTCSPVRGSSYELAYTQPCIRLAPEMLYDAAQENQHPYMPTSDTLSDIGSAQGSGSIISTARDLWQWNRSLHEHKSVLPMPLYELLTQPKLTFNKHAYGVWNRNGVMHCTGKYGAYTAQLMYLVQDNVSIIMLCNVDRDGLSEHKKFKEVEAQLALTVSDKDELQKQVSETMRTKHFSKRGATIMFEYLHKIVDTIDPS